LILTVANAPSFLNIKVTVYRMNTKTIIIDIDDYSY
jgi:hypothetical protein